MSNNTDANGSRLLRTTPGIIANILIVAPTSFFATRVTRTLIEKARPSDLTKAGNIAFSIGAWGLSTAAGGIAGTELFKVVRDIEDAISPENETQPTNPNTIDGEVIDVTVE